MNIVIIGSGNIATHLAKSFVNQGHDIVEVYSKTSANAKTLADAVYAYTFTTTFESLNLKADLYLIAVADSAITDVIDELPDSIEGLVIHTSGATPLDILAKFKAYGVIYPPQSINKNIETDLSKIPFGIEGNTKEVQDILFNFMQALAPKTFICNSKQRLALHISAVLVNNFPNALYQIANDILQKENLKFDLIKPIILETAQKVQTHLPELVQTGPAIRNDLNTIDKHLQFLSYSKELSEIYQILTDFIIKRHLKSD